MRSLATTALLLLSLLTLTSTTGCKLLRKKKVEPSAGAYQPPPPTAGSFYELRGLCSTHGKPEGFGGAPAYVKGASPDQPSKVAIFRRYADSSTASYEHQPTKSLGAMGSVDSEASKVQLVACVDATKESDEHGYCGYYGATLLLYKMKFKLRVLEAKTGRSVLEDEFVLDHKTSRCPGSYEFPKNVTSVYEGADMLPKVASELMSLEPDGLALGPVSAEKLDDVCVGSAVPQAAKYVPGAPARVHVVYFFARVISDAAAALGAAGRQGWRAALRSRARGAQAPRASSSACTRRSFAVA